MGIIGTIQDLLHARLQAGQEGAPSPATGPDDRRGVVAPGPVDCIRPAAVDRTDSLQTLLDLLTEETYDDFAIGNSAPNEWYVLAYWRDFEGDGEFELSVTGDTLRGALCAAIAHPRFGQ